LVEGLDGLVCGRKVVDWKVVGWKMVGSGQQ